MTKSTIGNTHGAIVTTVAATGDVIAGQQQMRNLQVNSSLTAGQLYLIAGPGLQPGAFFQYESGTTVDLSSPATESLSGATYTITKPTPLANAIVTFSGSTVRFADPSFLVPGNVYGIGSTAIGEYFNNQTGEPVLVNGNAFFIYEGGGSAQLQALIEITSTTPIVDPITHQEFFPVTVATVAVNALSGGTVTAVITGFQDEDEATLVDGMPAADLASLTAGLRYNFAGPGIPVGATFLAPPAGSTSIILDRAATDSALAQQFIISGPRVPNAPFDPVADAREDEAIFGFEIDQSEGDFAKLTIDLKNPGVGLLAPGRNLWCWLSWDRAWTPQGGTAPDIVPLFNGRLVGMPKRQAEEIVRLEFLARPEDFFAQQAAIANSLYVLPFVDPVWITTKNANDPDVVLEAYSALWHVDRTSLVVTTSDIIEGEDGTITIDGATAFYDDFDLTYSQPPLNAVAIEATVSWTQQGDGQIDITDRICGAFADAGSPKIIATTLPNGLTLSPASVGGNVTTGGGGLISMLVGDGLKNDWPKAGASIGGGWSLTTGVDSEGTPWNYIIDALQTNGGWLQPTYYNVQYAGMGAIPGTAGASAADQQVASLATGGFSTFAQSFPVSIYKIRFNVDYRASRKRTETIAVVLTAETQQVLSDPAAADTETLRLTSEFVGEAIDPGGGVPIGDLRRNSYFQTDRGIASFEYLLLLARAKMRHRGRAVDVTIGMHFEDAVGITLRKNIQYLDYRLPGGACTGKVKRVTLSVSDIGMLAKIVIGCSIGTGSTVSGSAGTGVYAAPGYMAAGYQVMTGEIASLITGEIAYQTLDQFVVEDDGVDLFNMTSDTAVNFVTVTNGIKAQIDNLKQFQGATFATFGFPNFKRQLTTKVDLDLKPVTGSEFHTTFSPSVTPLALPRSINLEAAG